MKSVGICSIATNGYDKYLIDCIDSYSKVKEKNFLTNWYIFSDVAEELSRRIIGDKSIRLHFFQIDSYGWPEATLLRYQIYVDHLNSLNDDYLMHLDADMLFLPEFKFPVLETDSCGMFFVRHPGFANSRVDARKPLISLKMIWKCVLMGGYGSWETQRKSKAYVPRSLRRIYFCGGIWFGKKECFNDFVLDGKDSVAQDLSNDFVAKWHDESHLNRFAAYNKVQILGPEYCFDGKVNLGIERPLVIAVEK